tara:strand:+ start:1211 stop:1321 length:111 start_codon:yes stop_codon:yes gene_type:complete
MRLNLIAYGIISHLLEKWIDMKARLLNKIKNEVIQS